MPNRPLWLITAGTTGPSLVQESTRTQTFDGSGLCNELYPAFQTARHVAGAPLANNIVTCALEPMVREDYAVTFTDDEWLRLQRSFPGGVCGLEPARSPRCAVRRHLALLRTVSREPRRGGRAGGAVGQESSRPHATNCLAGDSPAVEPLRSIRYP